MNEHLVALRSQEWFRQFKEQLIKDAPTVRSYNPLDEHSVENWKADSMRRQGYMLCLQKFGYQLKDLEIEAMTHER